MPLAGKRVLVVEDEAMLIVALQDILRDLGCENAVAEAGLKNALQRVQNQPFDVAVLDINLAGSDVSPVADALAARSIPFVFASGYSSGHIPARHANRPRVEKPYRGDQLRAALIQALGRDT
jgi:CheY-like chemotaxis protein